MRNETAVFQNRRVTKADLCKKGRKAGLIAESRLGTLPTSTKAFLDVKVPAQTGHAMTFFQKRRNLKHAKELLHHCHAVRHMRRDVLPADALASLATAISGLATARQGRDFAALERALREAEAAATAANPPRALPHLRELTETLVVAFGVAMAFRAYFFQPFKIPTGSMQPTLYGHHSVGRSPDGTPVEPTRFDRLPMKPLKWLFTGKWYNEIIATDAGSVVVSADRANAPGYVTVTVRGKRHKVPQDAYDRDELSIRGYQRVREAGMADAGGHRIEIIGRGMAQSGDRIWAGYQTFGDHVFVNRMKWNFFPPRRGQIMVFGTDGIPDLNPGEHYIKRLVGLPGETLSVRSPYLTVDGEPVTSPETVLRIAEKREAWKNGPRYLGYALTGHAEFMSQIRRIAVRCPLGMEGDVMTLGSDQFLPMGDNTANSFDGRYWGAVPRRRLVGPASCIYWPFSPRWGRVD